LKGLIAMLFIIQGMGEKRKKKTRIISGKKGAELLFLQGEKF